MKTILLTGKNGQVGWELARTLAPLGKVVALDAGTLNLADPAAVREAVRAIRPQIIVNPAASTAVDKAESEPVLAPSVNGDAPGVPAEGARAPGARVGQHRLTHSGREAGEAALHVMAAAAAKAAPARRG